MTHLSSGNRYAEIKRSLEERRSELKNRVQAKLRNVRVDGVSSRSVSSLADIDNMTETDNEFRLIEEQARTLQAMDEALDRMGEGKFGFCCDCGNEISEQRLQALLFAVRCTSCEDAKEATVKKHRLNGVSYRNAS